MKLKFFGGLTAILCAFAMSATALAAPVVPALSQNSETQAYAAIYDARPPEFYDGGYWKTVKGNSVTCCASQRIFDDNGKVYWISDMDPLNDSSLFRRELKINVNPNAIDRVQQLDSSSPEKNDFLVVIDPGSIFEEVVTEFSVTYTAVKDATLSVTASGSREAGELAVKRGAKIVINYKLLIDGGTVFL